MISFRKITLFIFIALTAVALTSCGPDRRSTAEILDDAVSSGNINKWQDALEDAKNAARREPNNPSALMMLAIAYENTGRKDLAIQAARTAAGLANDDYNAQYLLGRLYYETPKNIQDCIEPLLRAKKIKPNDPNVLILLGQSARKLNLQKPEQYYAALTKTARFKKRPEPWNEMGIIYASRNDLGNAANCFVNAYRAAPDNHTVVRNLAIFMDRCNRKKKAVLFYKKYIDLIAGNPEMEHLRRQVRRRIREISS